MIFASSARHCRTALLVTAVALVCSADTPRLHGQSNTAISRALDSIAGAEVRASRSVGIVAAVSEGDKSLLVSAYGKADVERSAPLTTGTLLPIGSVTKQFTAVAILQLRDQGKLSLDDDVKKWLPELNAGNYKITLRQLLAHTAGMVDVLEMPELRAANMMRNPALTRDSIYTIITHYAPAFVPGSLQSYSNTGYWLLGRIVESASGMTYQQYMTTRVFKPLGMMHSANCDNSMPAPERAYGYTIRNSTATRVPDVLHNGTFASGAICSTAPDMITWLRALHGGKVLSPKSYAELITPQKLNDGTLTRYGMGTTVAEDSHGLRYVGHNGGGFGYSSEARWYGQAKLAIVVLTNSEPDAITMTTEAIAAALLPPAHLAGSFQGDAAGLVGKYKGLGGGGDMIVLVTQTPAGLVVSVNGQTPVALPWVEQLTFRHRDELLAFRIPRDSSRANELHYDTGGDHFILKRVAITAATAAAPLTTFEGTYEGPAPGTTVKIAVENDTLRVLASSGSRVALIPASGTTFYNGREGSPRTITFNLGADGKAVSMTLKGPGGDRTLPRLP